MEALPGHQMRQPNSPAWPSTWHGDLRDPHGSTWVYLRRAAPPGVECGRLERRTRPGRIADEDRPARRGRDAEQLLAELHKLDGVETDEAPTRAARRQRVELTRRLLHLAHLGDRCRVQVMDTYFAYKEGSDPVEEPWSGAKDE